MWLLHLKNTRNFPNQTFYDEIFSKEPEDWILQTPLWSQKTEVVILVLSKYSDKDLRNEIRRSWAAKTNLYIRSKRVSVVFLLGHDGDGIAHYQDEYNKYKDLFFVDILDEYKNLVFKEAMAYRYISAVLPRAHLVKMDSDCILDINGLMEFMDNRREPITIYGALLHQTRPIRDPLHKWYLPERLFADNTFPDYVMGIFYIIPAQALRALVAVAPEAKVVELEDVFWTGILRKLTGKVKAVNLLEVDYFMRDMTGCPTEQDRKYFSLGFENRNRVTIEKSYKDLLNWKKLICKSEDDISNNLSKINK